MNLKQGVTKPVPGSEMVVESRSVIRNAKNARGLGTPAATAPFPKSCGSYFRFARFNTFPLYYLRAWHRLGVTLLWKLVRTTIPSRRRTVSSRSLIPYRGTNMIFVSSVDLSYPSVYWGKNCLPNEV